MSNVSLVKSLIVSDINQHVPQFMNMFCYRWLFVSFFQFRAINGAMSILEYFVHICIGYILGVELLGQRICRCFTFCRYR